MPSSRSQSDLSHGASAWADAFSNLEQRVLLSDGGGGYAGSTYITWHGVSVEVVPHSWIITYDDLLGPAGAVASANQVIARLGVQGTDVRAIGRGGYATFNAVGNFNEADAARAVSQSPGVVQVEPNLIEHTFRTPNDPLFSTQWAHQNTGQFIPGSGFGTLGADMHSTQAWNTTIGSQSVIIADIDTGLDVTHPDLATNVWQNPGEIPGNGIDDDGNGLIDDVRGWDFDGGDNSVADGQGHGTFTAGTIGAVGNNGIGVAGVMWTVSLLPVKVFPDAGGGAALANIVAAHDYLTDLIVNHHYNIVASNNSYGAFLPTFFNQFRGAEEMAIQRFTNTGATFVASAGNNANNNDANFTSFPASYANPEIISVAATDNRDALANFSNYGLATVDLGAPGVNILSTVPGGGYAIESGTSFSGPYTAGAVGLLKSHKPNASQAEIKRALIDGCDPVPGLQNLVVSGGRLNIARSLQLIDIEGPRVVAVSPGPVAAGVTHLQVQFDRPIDPASFNASFITLVRANGDGLFNGNDISIPVVSGEVSLNGSVLTVDLSGVFPAGLPVDLFRLTLDAHGFRDFNGNFLNGTTAQPGPGNNLVYDFQVVISSGAFEPNDTIPTATPVIFDASGEVVFPNASVGDGANNSLDIDLYKFTLSGPGLVVASVIAQNRAIPSGLDSYIRLFNAAGAELAHNDNFSGLDSRVDFFVPTGGTYYIGVTGFGNSTYNALNGSNATNQSIGDYDLSLTVNLAATETTTYNATTTPTPIPDPGTLTSTITINDSRAIVDVNVRLNILHPFDGDLQVRLISPRGTVVALVLNRGNSGDNFTNTVFDDETGASIVTAGAPFTGSFRPETPLSQMDGESGAGAWRLQIVDTKATDAGTLLSWGLDFVVQNNIFGPFESNDTLGIATALGINGTGTQTISADIGDGAFGLRDVDLFRFTAAPGTTLTAAVTATAGNLDTVMRLFDASGAELIIDNRADTTSGSISFAISNGSTFYIGISGGGNISYSTLVGGSGSQAAGTGSYTLQVSVVGGISNGAAIVRGNHVNLGVNADGSIGIATGSQHVGVSLNGTDFIVPQEGSPTIESFFGGTYSGFIFRNAGPASQSDLPVSITDQSDFNNRRLVIEGLFRSLGVRRTFSYGLNDQFIAVDVTLTNISTTTMTNLAWMEAFNAETGLNRRTTNNRTVNDVDGTGRLATAAFIDNDFPGGFTVGIGAADPAIQGAHVLAAVQDPNSVRDPFQIINNPARDPNGVAANRLIALAYNFGTLAGESSISFRYFIFAGDSVDAVNAEFTALDSGTGAGHLVADPEADHPAETLPYVAYYPEGYANSRASTFLPISNPNASDTRVVVIAHYERGVRDQVLYDSLTGDLNADGVPDRIIAAHSRSGLTITTPAEYAAGTLLVRPDEPYALEIRSSRPVAANMSHFDFGVSTGTAFTSVVSSIWTIAEGFKGTGVNDFVVFYNPQPITVKVTLTIYPENGAPAFSIEPQEVQAFRRGGWALSSIAQIPDGPFGMKIDAEQPIVAALSHYDTNIGGGFGILGQANAGSLTGDSPEGRLGISATSEFVTILNPNTAGANINFTFFFENGSAYRQQVAVAPNRRGGFSVALLPAFPAGTQPYSITYTSDQPITVNLASYATNATIGTRFADNARSVWNFAEGFRPLNGTQVTEYLRIFNPTAAAMDIEITINFNDGGTETFRRSVLPRSANQFNVHDFVTGSRRVNGTVPGVGSFYSLSIKAPQPIVAYMAHFDSTFFGGFGTLGMPLGLEQPLS